VYKCILAGRRNIGRTKEIALDGLYRVATAEEEEKEDDDDNNNNNNKYRGNSRI